MGFIETIKCKKCGYAINLPISVDGINQEGENIYNESFLCKDCGALSIIDTNNEKIYCKKCKSKNITKYFKHNEIKCSKCEENGFELIKNVQT